MSGGAGAAWVVVPWVVVLCPTPVSVHSHGRLAGAPVATDPEARRGGAGDRIVSIAADRPRIAEALGHFAWGTRQCLLVTTVFGLIVAVLDTIALAILGIPLAITWGLLSFITNYIPNIGFILGVIPPALLGLLTGGPKLMVIVIVVYWVLNTVIHLGDSAATPPVSGDAAENRRNFLVAVDRVVGVTDVALADFTVLRDDAPTTEDKRLFGLIVDEFTSARGSFVKARDAVGRSDPLTIGAYTTGNARFADGARNMSFAAQLLQQVKLPEDYTDEGTRNPRCNR